MKLEIENHKKNKASFFVGIDEVGRGSWAGPIVACSCWINPKSFRELPPNINDSKKLSELISVSFMCIVSIYTSQKGETNIIVIC